MQAVAFFLEGRLTAPADSRVLATQLAVAAAEVTLLKAQAAVAKDGQK